jgi:Tfp pilus assembly protein PilF
LLLFFKKEVRSVFLLRRPNQLDVPAVIEQTTSLFAARQLEQAVEVASKAALEDPAQPPLHNLLGVMLAGAGRYEAAVAAYRRALALPGAEPAVWTNLGNALTHLRQYATAIACHDRALASLPGDGGLHYNRGISLAGADRHAEAVAAFSRAQKLDPLHSMALWDRARSYLHLGNFSAGWADYAVRLKNGLVPARTTGLGEAWDGTPFPKKRLVLLAEQGFGDMIWTFRYLSMVCALGGEVVLEAPAELAALFAASGFLGRIIVQGAPLPACDLHLHQCSLPGFFTPDLKTIPACPYIRPDPSRASAMRARLAPADGTLRVGIVWSGSVTFGGNAARSQTLARFITAFDQPGVTLYSLQKGFPAEQIQGQDRVIDLAPALADFADTASAIAALDLIIMCDSAVAHLAGAMGREVWVLLGPNAHWLWMQGRTDCPWYPSMRLFRPRHEADWDGVFDQAAHALMQRV